MAGYGRRRLKTVTSVSALSLAGALALQSCSDDSTPNGVTADDTPKPAIITEGGEGEGEGEGASSADPAIDDVEYLHRLGQVRGHLVAFIELDQIGAYEMSATHAKHPESELYADLVPAFQARNKPGFADELNALVAAMDSRDGIDTAYDRIKSAITANEPDVSIATWLNAISVIARTAGDEFKIGVADDGTITNTHEYQDAYGFLTAARETVGRLSSTSADETAALALAEEQLSLALNEFSDLKATKIEGRSSPIYAAAARIEIAGLGLE